MDEHALSKRLEMLADPDGDLNGLYENLVAVAPEPTIRRRTAKSTPKPVLSHQGRIDHLKKQKEAKIELEIKRKEKRKQQLDNAVIKMQSLQKSIKSLEQKVNRDNESQ